MACRFRCRLDRGPQTLAVPGTCHLRRGGQLLSPLRNGRVHKRRMLRHPDSGTLQQLIFCREYGLQQPPPLPSLISHSIAGHPVNWLEVVSREKIPLVVSFDGNKCYICTRIQIKTRLMKLKVVLMEEAAAFIAGQSVKAQQKIYYNIFKVEEGIREAEIFKKLENTDIWEFRTLYNGICYRLFSFWDTDTDTMVVATHGIVKKTMKTPVKEIAKAEEIRKEYFRRKKR